MQQVTVQNPDDILSLLADVALRGSGFVPECLLDYVLAEGFTERISLHDSGEDPDAYFKGQSPAWAVYQVREWKRVLTISGGPGKQRRVQITETPSPFGECRGIRLKKQRIGEMSSCRNNARRME